MAFSLGFADMGCAKIEPLSDSELSQFRSALEQGFFGSMEYLARNGDKREDPTLLLPGAKSILVFLAPFSANIELQNSNEEKLRISEFALGSDYHTVIKTKLYHIANCLDKYMLEKSGVSNFPPNIVNPNFKRYKSLTCRVFTDSAPVMERNWAVRAGLGFIGKNNFLISKKCGVKNFIGTIITTIELPYCDTSSMEYSPDMCGKCTRCLDACTQNALFAPRKLDARKCLSYKNIEDHSEVENAEPYSNPHKWIFGCDDCMNACPWNRMNYRGWEEFHTNLSLLRSSTSSSNTQEWANGERREWWKNLSEEEFDKLFKDSPLHRAGLKKINETIDKLVDKK